MCRLAYEQGILKGDLNDLQQFALTVVMRQNAERDAERELMRFKMTAIAVNPKQARKIMAIGNQEEAPTELTEEEMASALPIQEQPEVKSQILADLRSMGLAVVDD